MENGADLEAVRGDLLEAALGIFADPNGPLGIEGPEDRLEVTVTGPVEEFLFCGGEFVGSVVAAGFLHEDEGAVVENEVVGEKFPGRCEALLEEPPEPPAAHFRALASEAFDGAFGVFVRGFSDLGVDSDPVANELDFTERDANLGHAPRAWIHPEEDDAFFRVSKGFQVGLVGVPSVVQRIVDVGDRISEGEEVDLVAKLLRRFDEHVSDGTAGGHWRVWSLG
jgi:hypothetical protein